MSDTKIDSLSSRMKPLACELIAKCIEARIDVRIIETLRSKERQAELIEKGVSWTTNSKHLTGDAIDIAPVAVLPLKNWAPYHPHWNVIGEIGENLGLSWGGRWHVRDCAHFEFTGG